MYPDARSTIGRGRPAEDADSASGAQYANPRRSKYPSSRHTYCDVRSARSVHELFVYPTHHAKFGTPPNIIPLYARWSPGTTARPSTVSSIPPNATSRRPVAVTMMSASSERPEDNDTPDDVNREIRSVTTSALPERNARNRSASGTRHSRWSHGSYDGTKCGSTGIDAGSCAATRLRNASDARRGNRRISWKNSVPITTFLPRTTRCASFSGSSARSRSASASRPGRATMYDGDRCSIVTCEARDASAGTSVTAVAPLPITTTRLSV